MNGKVQCIFFSLLLFILIWNRVRDIFGKTRLKWLLSINVCVSAGFQTHLALLTQTYILTWLLGIFLYFFICRFPLHFFFSLKEWKILLFGKSIFREKKKLFSSYLKRIINNVCILEMDVSVLGYYFHQMLWLNLVKKKDILLIHYL